MFASSLSRRIWKRTQGRKHHFLFALCLILPRERISFPSQKETLKDRVVSVVSWKWANGCRCCVSFATHASSPPPRRRGSSITPSREQELVFHWQKDENWVAPKSYSHMEPANCVGAIFSSKSLTKQRREMTVVICMTPTKKGDSFWKVSFWKVSLELSWKNTETRQPQVHVQHKDRWPPR